MKTLTVTEEVTLAYTNAFGEDMRIPFTPKGYEWRRASVHYTNVRVEKRVVEITFSTTEWTPVDPASI